MYVVAATRGFNCVFPESESGMKVACIIILGLQLPIFDIGSREVWCLEVPGLFVNFAVSGPGTSGQDTVVEILL